MARSIQAVTLLVVFMALDNTSAAEKGEHGTLTTGYQVGQLMPNHVVDFIGGTREEGCGCPAVMIKNSRQRGIEIWSRGADAQAERLATLLDEKLGQNQRERGFLILFGHNDPSDVIAQAKTKSFSNFLITLPRGSSEKSFAQAAESKGSQLIVFFLDRKKIIQRYELSSPKLSQKGGTELMKNAEQFLAEDD